MTKADTKYVFDDDPSRVDVDAVWAFLSTEAYWLTWRTREDFVKQLTGAWRVVGIYDPDGAQVGFARAVSDGVNDAYLADVYVHPDHRGHGLSKQLMATMIDEGPGARFRWSLFTRDAHGLYEQFGFGEPGPMAMVRPANRG